MKNLIMFLPSVNKGGNEKNFFSTANQLNKNKVKIFVISCDGNEIQKNLDFKNQIYSKNYERLNLKIKYLICFFILIFNNKKKFPILSFQGNITAIVAAKIIGCKVFIRFNSSLTILLVIIFKNFFLNFFIVKLDGIFVNSKEMKLRLKKIFGLNSNLVYNNLNIKKIKLLSKKKIKLVRFKNSNLKKIIIIIKIDKNKNHKFLVETLNRISKKLKFNLLILGSGPEKNNLKQLIYSYGLNDKIKIISYKKNPYPYIKACDFLILSSFYEGYPNVLIEAGCLNKLIISSSCKTGPKEIINNNKNGYLYKSNNYKSLSTTLEKVNSNKEKNKKKIINLNRYITKFHNIDNSKKYLDFIFVK